mmetsp:Transcript_46118/g.116112  ORF Transcript_46118/g.116112 Transcript_46118/m.116112 type:complete len:294 (-) Transcript_46118:453-1334(-)
MLRARLLQQFLQFVHLHLLMKKLSDRALLCLAAARLDSKGALLLLVLREIQRLVGEQLGNEGAKLSNKLLPREGDVHGKPLDCGKHVPYAAQLGRVDTGSEGFHLFQVCQIAHLREQERDRGRREGGKHAAVSLEVALVRHHHLKQLQRLLGICRQQAHRQAQAVDGEGGEARVHARHAEEVSVGVHKHADPDGALKHIQPHHKRARGQHCRDQPLGECVVGVNQLVVDRAQRALETVFMEPLMAGYASEDVVLVGREGGCKRFYGNGRLGEQMQMVGWWIRQQIVGHVLTRQ